MKQNLNGMSEFLHDEKNAAVVNLWLFGLKLYEVNVWNTENYNLITLG